MNEEDLKLLAKYLLGGAAVGGTTIGLSNLYKYLAGQKDLKKINKEDDDDTLYIFKKQSNAEEQGSKDSTNSNWSWVDGLGIGTAVVGGLGTFLLGQNLINYIRKKQAQKELDKAQRMALNAQGYDVLNKKANDGSGDSLLTRILNSISTYPGRIVNTISDGASSVFGGASAAGTALASLLYLTGGIGTYYYLKNQYPIKQKEVKLPKKFKIVDPEENTVHTQSRDEDEQELIDDIIKQSSADVVAHMLHSTYKSASSASDIIATVASGDIDRLELNIAEYGLPTALDMIKGASCNEVNPTAEALAIQYCTKFAKFAPQFNLLAATEYAALNPDLVKLASNLVPEVQAEFLNTAQGVSELFKAASVQELNMTEDIMDAGISGEIDEDSIEGGIGGAIKRCIEKLAGAASPIATQTLETDSTQLSGQGITAASAKPEEVIKQENNEYKDAVRDNVNNADDDPVDQALGSTEFAQLPVDNSEEQIVV